jgi:hypothetical protein
MNIKGDFKIAQDINLEDYDKISVDTFGKEMLYKMGWKDNTPLKKDGPIKPIELKARSAGLGLGADPLIVKKTTSDKNEIMKNHCHYGTKVKITHGKHKGLKAKIIERDIGGDLDKFLKESKYVNVELKINKDVVKVQSEFIKIRSKGKDKEKDKKKNKSLSPSNRNNKSRSRSRNRSKEKEKSQILNSKNNTKSINLIPITTHTPNNKLTPLKWVHPNILVRIISKETKFYNRKGIITDLLDLFNFSIFLLDDKTLHTEFSENDIETVIPKTYEDIIILNKEHRGEKAKLILRDKKTNKVSVQLYSDLSIVELTQDDVAAYAPMYQ